MINRRYFVYARKMVIVTMYRYSNNTKPNYSEDKASNSRDVEKLQALYSNSSGFVMGWVYELLPDKSRGKKLAYFDKRRIQIYL